MALNLKWTRRTFMGSFGASACAILNSRKLFGGTSPTAGKGADKISGFGENLRAHQPQRVEDAAHRTLS